ncbi:hypothetical protein BS78_K241800 [Paspalum vaginatum]|uniref:KIB1-4 beta-propeller domain-containing protein n=1 Tax=Paspalum vaginatum TaxID=158149 RepID=A0A9W7X7L5_9POAL|nr:hypothetical protein BS78_K241800 [Paspalum vaginatum]
MASSFWAGLPFDLIRDISCRLHDAADYVRFHAVCKPWRDTLPPARCRPLFLPWLLTLSRDDDAVDQRTARCVFISSNRRRGAATGIRIQHMNWVISACDGMAARLLTGFPGPVVAGCPLTGSAAAGAPLPGYSEDIKQWVDLAVGTASGDGTILLCSWVPRRFQWPYDYTSIIFNMALLRPGDKAWMFLRQHHLDDDDEGIRDHCCVAYHDGMVVVCCQRSLYICSAQPQATYRSYRLSSCKTGKIFVESSYLVESHGELLWVLVWDTFPACHQVGVCPNKTPSLSVKVYALRGGGKHFSEWEMRDDGQSLADQVLFLGHPTSFVVDASQLGMIGGCAYFNLHSKQYNRMIKYNFREHQFEFLEQLPDDFDGKMGTWITPQPVIASTKVCPAC